MKQYSKKATIGKGYLLPLVFFMGIIPFIVRHKEILMDMSIFDWYSNTTTFNDFFTYYKSMMIICSGIFMLLALIYYLNTQRNATFKPLKIYIPLAVYFIFMVGSWLTSDYLSVSTLGFKERFEGGLVLSCYLIIFVYITQMIRHEDDIKFAIKGLIISIVVMNLVGLLQYLKIDYLSFKFFKWLILGDLIDKANMSSTVNAGRVYMTLYHPNYVGLYISLALPLTLTFFLFTKKLWHKMLWLGLSIVVFINLLGSQSRGGLVGVAVAGVFALILLRKKIFRYWKLLIPFGLIMCGVFYLANERVDGFYTDRIHYTLKQTFGEKKNYYLDEIITKDKSATIRYKDTLLEFTYDEPMDFDTFQFTVQGEDISVIRGEQAGSFTLNYSLYKELDFSYVVYKDVGPHLVFRVPGYKEPWRLSLGDEKMAYRNPYGKESPMNPIPAYGFEGKEKIGSYRGYIWSRSNPLVLKHLFLGSGPDTFIFEFPQRDYLGKYNAYGTTNIIVDKPHSIYYQLAINTGLISLLAMVVIWGMYIWSSIKLYFKDALDTPLSIIGVALTLGIIGFLGAGFFNDTNVNVSPVYWGMLGLGFATNNIVVKKKEGILK